MKILKKNIFENKKLDIEYPLIPLRDMVIFPGMLKSFYVGRNESIEAINLSLSSYNKNIFLATQKNSTIENPEKSDIYEVGIIANIKEVNSGYDKNILKILIQGLERAEIINFYDDNKVKKVNVKKIQMQTLDNSLKSETLLNLVIKEFKKFSNLKKLSQDILNIISKSENENDLINLIIPHLKTTIDKQIEILKEKNTEKRIKLLTEIITSNIEILQLEKKINFEVKKRIDKNQREYFLTEQMKEIQKELGDLSSEDVYNHDNFYKTLEEIGIPENAKSKVLKEYKRLSKMPSLSPESSVIRSYIDCILDLPWSKKTEDSKDLKNAKIILDEDHYSLNKVKTRILEFLAVRQLNPKIKGPILCFVGPPGTGKTSLGKSVARTIGREFVRISLGGVRDEAEIRGHRRTYLGALPGKIIQSMKKVKTKNPVFLLDEIDKMSSDFRGDPSSALLEVLDPEQNNQFVDHYLEIPYDLSEVMFITTANSKQGIPYPLLDRMEIIYISSYTELEKLNIAKKFLIPKEKIENGLNDIEIKIKDSTILKIIRSYTMEAGVRSLQRQIASIFRKLARKIILNDKKNNVVFITNKNLIKFLGKPKFLEPSIDEVLDVGVAHGLAWSELGGSILPIEIVLYPGSGNIILTGKLGDVMKESAQTAYSYIKANFHQYDIKYKEFYKKYDVHIHFPEGAVPKDGPSAGIAITCGILSSLTKTPIHSKFAMTGEITLTGKILPIGGLKEKALAAARHKKEKIIIPFENEKDIDELPKTVKEKLEFITVKRATDVFKLVFDQSINAKKNKNIEDDLDFIENKKIKKKDFNNIITQ